MRSQVRQLFLNLLSQVSSKSAADAELLRWAYEDLEAIPDSEDTP